MAALRIETSSRTEILAAIDTRTLRLSKVSIVDMHLARVRIEARETTWRRGKEMAKAMEMEIVMVSVEVESI